MTKFSIIVISLLLIAGCVTSDNNEPSATLVSDSEVLDKLFLLSENQGYFELKSFFEKNKVKLSEDHILFFNAIIENAFNNPNESNISISTLIGSDSRTIDDTLMQSLYRIKILNHTNLYEYELASKTSDNLVKKYNSTFDSLAMEDVINTGKIWSALKDVPKQKLTRNQDFTIPLAKDIAGLYNIEVTFPDTTKHLIFDTGANFSVIRRSLVEQYGLTLIKSDFLVNSATGTKVKSDLAVADKIDIGGITCENVIFLVFEDEDLSFPGYDIYGIIGYPVIEAMKEIHITKDDQLFVPKDLTHYTTQNFALHGFLPVVLVKQNEDSLLFHFDTGANSTSLYPKYFMKYKSQIEENNKKETFTAGSAGGLVEFEGYKISGLNLSVAGAKTELDSLYVHINTVDEKDRNFHGNLGQDFIKQFDKLIISFEDSSILFK